VILFSQHRVHNDCAKQRQKPDKPKLRKLLVANIEIRSPNAPRYPHLKGKQKDEERNRKQRHCRPELNMCRLVQGCKGRPRDWLRASAPPSRRAVAWR
jgi:hypothetical protein